MTEQIEDIVIVGGGPAGSYLGYLLAKNGISSIIFDHSHPREKPCGGGITAFAVEKFPFLHEIPEEIFPENEMELISSKGMSVMTRGEKSSWTLSRLSFDKFILDKALEAGAKLITEKVTSVKLKNDVWEIKTKEGIYKAKLLIGADGVNSIVRKNILGPLPRESIGVCYGCFAISEKQEIPRMKFLPDKQGYAWCAPRRDHLSIGVGTTSSDAENIKKLFQDFISSYYPHVKIQSKWGAKIPNIKDSTFYALPCADKNWILIGDAAGHVDSITGDGISYALWSAELAAEAILNNDPQSFDTRWRKAYGEKLMAGCKMRNIFYNPSLLEYSLKIAAKSNTFSNLLYDIVNSQQNYQALLRRMIIDSPKIIKEYLLSHLRMKN